MAFNYYNSQANQQKQQNPSQVQGRTIQAGQDLNTGRVGKFLTSQLAEADAYGQNLTPQARYAGTEALQQAMSTANPADISAQNSLRDYYTQSLGNLGTLGDNRGSALDTQMQSGLSNLLSQYKNANAGTGRIGTAQYDRGAGDITQKVASEYVKGLQDLQGQNLQSANQVGQGLSGVYNQDLAERQFQNQQASNYANFLTGQAQNALGQEGAANALKQQQDAANQAFWGQILGTAGQVGGAYLGRPKV